MTEAFDLGEVLAAIDKLCEQAEGALACSSTDEVGDFLEQISLYLDDFTLLQDSLSSLGELTEGETASLKSSLSKLAALHTKVVEQAEESKEHGVETVPFFLFLVTGACSKPLTTTFGSCFRFFSNSISLPRLVLSFWRLKTFCQCLFFGFVVLRSWQAAWLV